MKSSTSLLDLPNELILIISSQLSVDILHLATTCQHLNSLLLPDIFRRFGLGLPSDSFSSIRFTAENLDVLPVLTIGSSVHSITELDVRLYARMARPKFSPEENLTFLAALSALVLRLPSLGRFTFGPYPMEKTIEALPGLPHALATVLNSAATRGDCIITVFGRSLDPPPFVHSVPTIHSNPAPLSTTFLQRAFTWFLRFSPTFMKPSTGVIESTQLPSAVNLPFLSHSALRVLNIRCSFLFHATFYKWTLHMLNTSPLTTLSLHHIDLSHYDWALVLPALTLSLLTNFSIGHECAISVPDLALFLTRHPSIQTLDLSYHLAIGALAHPPADHLLPHLTTLRAAPDYMLYFLLRPQTKGGIAPCPELREVTVTWTYSSECVPTYQVGLFASVVSCIEARRGGVVPRLRVEGNLAAHCQVPKHLQIES
ncbi:hypothetical protein C8F04DRAFT_1107652 [Mycena alexandri]|uniref:F-box domain-containing protein n=1 Tax=Mycena alexandri TaxID=1745969 RepID=A0AAD6S766_9AGAR|nr:hypothetical protein C8F04DRAFT_1140198 [Mycena alexandri]KAJ7032447.1 hypothetical protein C8F04DRAFT_1107652 [Mycena alexandri]